MSASMTSASLRLLYCFSYSSHSCIRSFFTSFSYCTHSCIRSFFDSFSYSTHSCIRSFFYSFSYTTLSCIRCAVSSNGLSDGSSCSPSSPLAHGSTSRPQSSSGAISARSRRDLGGQCRRDLGAISPQVAAESSRHFHSLRSGATPRSCRDDAEIVPRLHFHRLRSGSDRPNRVRVSSKLRCDLVSI